MRLRCARTVRNPCVATEKDLRTAEELKDNERGRPVSILSFLMQGAPFLVVLPNTSHHHLCLPLAQVPAVVGLTEVSGCLRAPLYWHHNSGFYIALQV